MHMGFGLLLAWKKAIPHGLWIIWRDPMTWDEGINNFWYEG